MVTPKGWFHWSMSPMHDFLISTAQFKRLKVLRDLTTGTLACGLCWDGSEWTYLQLGQDGEDLERMTRRWQFKQAKAIMLPFEEYFFLESSSVTELPLLYCSEQVEFVEMLSSRSSFWSLGHSQLFLKVFLFR